MTTAPAQNSTRTANGSRRRRHRGGIGRPISRSAYLAVATATFLASLGLWWLLSAIGVVEEQFLPAPPRVLATLLEQADSGELWTDLAASTFRIAVGYLLATILAIPLGILAGSFRTAESIIEPLSDFIRYMPVVAFVPLTIVWVGTGEMQKYVIIFLGTFFQQLLMVSAETRRVPQDLINLGRTLGMPEKRTLSRIVVPSAAPGIWNALRVTLGWAWTWLVVAELVAATSGLGYRITVSQRYFETDVMIAYVLVLGLIGLILDQAMRAIGRWTFRHQEAGR
ncbi:ABC transporter permease [Brachybacterium sp. AOP42-C2-15]|uniref:ABC transporter permease n=1 Tax=Brachybacterium sp. AOP42-C2-15 TaxID=3457670 RepID=UPI003FDAF661